MPETPESVEMFGIVISRLSFDELCSTIEERIASGPPGFIVTPNVDHICTCYRDPEYLAVYRRAFLSLPDGMPLIWASYLFGAPIPQKLSGSDMVPMLSSFAAGKGYALYLLGGSPGAAEETAAILTRQSPDLKIAGIDCPPYGFEKSPEAAQAVADRLRDSKADLCFVALGAPKQERWMNQFCTEAKVPVLIGVGGAFEMVSGRLKRAPHWMQVIGFEWLWRLAQEPRRLWRRYLVKDMVFFKLLWLEFWKQWRWRKAKIR